MLLPVSKIMIEITSDNALGSTKQKMIYNILFNTLFRKIF